MLKFTNKPLATRYQAELTGIRLDEGMHPVHPQGHAGHAGAMGGGDGGGGNSGGDGRHGFEVGPHERAGGRLGKGEQADGVLSSVR